ncbi:hypothetical protein ACFONG_06200 [Uliginosibacterium paludis]|uniref:Uncharacterized protein n=1 Tax=Uliginosibacterium paludis TaxID=1615952 RepID=A0ABV2CLM7_9RHOO
MSYDAIKADRQLCTGYRKGGQAAKCNGQLYRCTACATTGCRQTYVDNCSEQAFDVNWKCVKCGAINQKEGPLNFVNRIGA